MRDLEGKKALNHNLQIFVNKCLRAICGIYYPEKISNTDLYARTGQQLIANNIGKRKWSWIGHTLRKSPEDITRQALSLEPRAAKSRDGPLSLGNHLFVMKQLNRAISFQRAGGFSKESNEIQMFR
ncbi:hypothetical protein PVAND_001992 [Polypedilum vanderplanki]|uniref:Uncharacterized protein n=1 Tax=Polypedilum vanderplanki TaxID=319348 RepID=A0A9J6BPM0_POLVA|nr:hypothetical protein PVAND_001992 [Polypedilum vanderplanki]